MLVFRGEWLFVRRHAGRVDFTGRRGRRPQPTRNKIVGTTAFSLAIITVKINLRPPYDVVKRCDFVDAICVFVGDDAHGVPLENLSILRIFVKNAQKSSPPWVSNAASNSSFEREICCFSPL